MKRTKIDGTIDGSVTVVPFSDKTPTPPSRDWRVVGVGLLAVTSACWMTAGALTYGITFLGASPYWIPVAAVTGFSGEICLVIGLSMLGFKQFEKRFAALKALTHRWLPPRS